MKKKGLKHIENMLKSEKKITLKSIFKLTKYTHFEIVRENFVKILEKKITLKSWQKLHLKLC